MKSIESIIKVQTRDFNVLNHPFFFGDEDFIAKPFGKDRFIIAHFQDYPTTYGEFENKWTMRYFMFGHSFTYYGQKYTYTDGVFYLHGLVANAYITIESDRKLFEELTKEYDRLNILQNQLQTVELYGTSKPKFVIEEEKLQISRMPRGFYLYICDSAGEVTKVIRVPKPRKEWYESSDTQSLMVIQDFNVYKHYIITCFKNPTGYDSSIYIVVDTKLAKYKILDYDYSQFGSPIFGDKYIIVYGSSLYIDTGCMYAAITYEELMHNFEVKEYTEIKEAKNIKLINRPILVGDILIAMIPISDKANYKALLIPIGDDKSPIEIESDVNVIRGEIIQISPTIFISVRKWSDISIQLLKIKRLDNGNRLLYIADAVNIPAGQIYMLKDTFIFKYFNESFIILRPNKSGINKLSDCLYSGKLLGIDKLTFRPINASINLFWPSLENNQAKLTYLSFLTPMNIGGQKPDVEFLFQSFIDSYACSEEIKNKFQVVQRRLYNEDDLKQEKEAFISFVKDYTRDNEFIKDFVTPTNTPKTVDFVFQDI